MIQAHNFTQMLLRDYSFYKSTRATQTFKMATIFFKMGDISGKEIIMFAQKCAYLSNWDDHGVKSYILDHVENEFGHL